MTPRRDLPRRTVEPRPRFGAVLFWEAAANSPGRTSRASGCTRVTWRDHGHRDDYHIVRGRTSRRRRGRDWYQRVRRSVTGRRAGIPTIHRSGQRQPSSTRSRRHLKNWPRAHIRTTIGPSNPAPGRCGRKTCSTSSCSRSLSFFLSRSCGTCSAACHGISARHRHRRLAPTQAKERLNPALRASCSERNP
jgi:hypothetical protein